VKYRRFLPGVLLGLIVGFGLTVNCHAQNDDVDLVDLVMGLLGDKDKDIRALGLEQIRTSAKGQAATQKFAARLPKLSPEAQIGLLSALADRGDSAARPAVLELLANSKEEPVRVAAIKAVGALGEPADTQLLVKLFSVTSSAEKSAARKSLTDLRGTAVPQAIAAEMKQAAAPLKATLIEILAARRAFETVADLLPAALDGDATVRTAFVCFRMEDAERRADPLLAAMKQLDEKDRRRMLSTLGRVGGSAALKIVEEAIASDDAQAHELGLKALCNWPDASVAARLTELAANDEHPAHQISALRALIRIAPLTDSRSDADRLQLLDKAMVMAARDTERKLVLDRARAIRTMDSLRFILPYVDQPPYAQQACLSVVELAHHRGLRQPNKAEFDRALDKVIATSKDATVIDRARRYKKGQTWVRPKKSK
jgi:HEAT repeat protein